MPSAAAPVQQLPPGAAQPGLPRGRAASRGAMPAIPFALGLSSIPVMALVFLVLLLSYVKGFNQYPKIAAGLFALLCLSYVFVLRRRMIFFAEYRWIAAWICLCGLTALFALDVGNAVGKWFTLLTVVPLSFMVCNTVVWQRGPAGIWLSLVAGALGMGVLSMLGTMATEGGRLSGTAANSNHMGYIFVMAEIFLLCWLFEARRWALRIAALLALAAVFYFIPKTGSKLALLGGGMVLVLFVGLKFSFRNARAAARSLALAGVVACALLLAFLYVRTTPYYDRLAAFIESVQSGTVAQRDRSGESTRYRFLFYKRGMEVFAAHPAVGVGLDNFRIAMRQFPEFRAGSSYAHSNYVELLVDSGLFGAMLYFAMYATLGLRLLRQRRRAPGKYRNLNDALLVALVFMVFADLTYVSYYDKVAWVVLASVIGASYLIDARSRAGV